VNVAAFQVSAGNRSSQQDEGDNAQGDRYPGDVREYLKSPDSVKFGDYTRSFQLPNIRAESYARTLSVEIFILTQCAAPTLPNQNVSCEPSVDADN
jgi:hypothetical protein